MKKKKLSNLKLNKVKIADLNTLNSIAGGATIESCIICEEPTPTDNCNNTVECETGGGNGGGGDSIVYCPSLNCIPTLYC